MPTCCGRKISNLLYCESSGLALAVEAAEALHLLSDYDSSGLTFAVRSFGRSAIDALGEDS